MVRISDNLSFEEIIKVVIKKESVLIDQNINKKVEMSFDFLKSFAGEKIIYGINTGFGPMAQYRVDDFQLKDLQYNIIRSHSCGAGALLNELYVRGALLARLSTFLKGMSGVNIELTDLLVLFINSEIYPIVPEHGGVGASGDLVQMAHIGLALIGEGDVIYKGRRRDSLSVMNEIGIKPLEIHIREGLAIANGTSVMSGIGAVNVYYSEKLIKWAMHASVLINEITSSYDDFVSKSLNNSRPHTGQLFIASEMRKSFKSSNRLKKREEELYEVKNSQKIFEHKVQGYYSLRCVPQILGPVYDAILCAKNVIVTEYNSVCDNPVVDILNENIYHGGNFHGDYVSFEMDKLKIAITKLTMLMERQLNYLLHDRINGILPPFLNLGKLGLNYGLQAAQFTATSTTAESQTLSNPMYVHSIPNNNDNQDIVSMGANSALIAAKVIENAFQVMAIHYMALCQAVDYLNISDDICQDSKEIFYSIRKFFPKFIEDTPKYKDIESIIKYLKDN